MEGGKDEDLCCVARFQETITTQISKIYFLLLTPPRGIVRFFWRSGPESASPTGKIVRNDDILTTPRGIVRNFEKIVRNVTWWLSPGNWLHSTGLQNATFRRFGGFSDTPHNVWYLSKPIGDSRRAVFPSFFRVHVLWRIPDHMIKPVELLLHVSPKFRDLDCHLHFGIT